MTLSKDAIEAARQVSSATFTTVMLKKGLRNTWMRGTKPVRPGQKRVVGRAFTLRFLPMREDMATPESWAAARSTRAAIEEMPADCICVTDARGVTHAGIFGDILCARMQQRGVAGLITDGAVRDVAGIIATHLPVWCAGVASPASVAGLTFAGWQESIGCGGVAIFPDDVVVADDDGAVVVPAALFEDVLKVASEQERFEAWIIKEVEKGLALPGLYPADAATRARYEKETGKK
jgi:regulator of RNase E activity RraA